MLREISSGHFFFKLIFVVFNSRHYNAKKFLFYDDTSQQVHSTILIFIIGLHIQAQTLALTSYQIPFLYICFCLCTPSQSRSRQAFKIIGYQVDNFAGVCKGRDLSGRHEVYEQLSTQTTANRDIVH